MTEKAKHLYQAAEDKFNWINNELRRLNSYFDTPSTPDGKQTSSNHNYPLTKR